MTADRYKSLRPPNKITIYLSCDWTKQRKAHKCCIPWVLVLEAVNPWRAPSGSSSWDKAGKRNSLHENVTPSNLSFWKKDSGNTQVVIYPYFPNAHHMRINRTHTLVVLWVQHCTLLLDQFQNIAKNMEKSVHVEKSQGYHSTLFTKHIF